LALRERIRRRDPGGRLTTPLRVEDDDNDDDEWLLPLCMVTSCRERERERIDALTAAARDNVARPR